MPKESKYPNMDKLIIAFLAKSGKPKTHYEISYGISDGSNEPNTFEVQRTIISLRKLGVVRLTEDLKIEYIEK